MKKQALDAFVALLNNLPHLSNDFKHAVKISARNTIRDYACNNVAEYLQVVWFKLDKLTIETIHKL